MKRIIPFLLVLLSWSLVRALQPIHVEDPADQEQQNPNPTASNTTFFLSVIPVQEPIRGDTPPPAPSEQTTTGNVTPGTESNIYEADHGDTTREDAPKTAHDHFRYAISTDIDLSDC